ncbi:DUF6088 family protein [Echinicola sp. 20G]|uniref:DUF6088 family protein n=1 Tax=Echinicola sp. 20G TaxID=2781961 RepID=UPI0019101553|nr:DUF6088 family protein [Echinicola sp. 20G]
MMNTERAIEKSIKSKPKGTLFFPEDFREYGSGVAVRKALQRLKEYGTIKSLAQGIYVRPKINPLIGEVLPTADEVAQAIAKRDKIRIVPTGTYALNALGLSTQVPMKLVFLTDGAPREIKLGKRSIKLKKTTPKNLAAKGSISALVIQALREIGKDHLSTAEKFRIIELLKSENPRHLKHDMDLAPVWIRQIMEKAL